MQQYSYHVIYFLFGVEATDVTYDIVNLLIIGLIGWGFFLEKHCPAISIVEELL